MFPRAALFLALEEPSGALIPFKLQAKAIFFEGRDREELRVLGDQIRSICGADREENCITLVSVTERTSIFFKALSVIPRDAVNEGDDPAILRERNKPLLTAQQSMTLDPHPSMINQDRTLPARRDQPSDNEREHADHEEVNPDGRSERYLWGEREIVDGVTADFEEHKDSKKEEDEATPSFAPLSHAVREMLWNELTAKGDPIPADVTELTEALLALTKRWLIGARRHRFWLHGEGGPLSSQTLTLAPRSQRRELSLTAHI